MCGGVPDCFGKTFVSVTRLSVNVREEKTLFPSFPSATGTYLRPENNRVNNRFLFLPFFFFFIILYPTVVYGLFISMTVQQY